MREIKKKSAVPLYGFAAVWLLYCLLFPLYKLWHFIVLILCSVVAYEVLSHFFPGTVEYVEEPKEPVSTGDEKTDKLLADGRTAVLEMKRLRASIQNEAVRTKIDAIIEVTEKIFQDVIDDPGDYAQIKRFADYFLPTTIKLLNAYDRMSGIGSGGDNITGTMGRIEAILDTTIEAYNKELDSLFANQALDIETDITVLESMMKKEGLAGKDFH